MSKTVNQWPASLKLELPRLTPIKLFEREGDCVAVPICEFLGNARKGCYDGGSTQMGQICTVSIILLLARLQGITIEKGEIKEPEPKEIGFKPQDGKE